MNIPNSLPQNSKEKILFKSPRRDDRSHRANIQREIKNLLTKRTGTVKKLTTQEMKNSLSPSVKTHRREVILATVALLGRELWLNLEEILNSDNDELEPSENPLKELESWLREKKDKILEAWYIKMEINHPTALKYNSTDQQKHGLSVGCFIILPVIIRKLIKIMLLKNKKESPEILDKIKIDSNSLDLYFTYEFIEAGMNLMSRSSAEYIGGGLNNSFDILGATLSSIPELFYTKFSRKPTPKELETMKKRAYSSLILKLINLPFKKLMQIKNDVTYLDKNGIPQFDIDELELDDYLRIQFKADSETGITIQRYENEGFQCPLSLVKGSRGHALTREQWEWYCKMADKAGFEEWATTPLSA